MIIFVAITFRYPNMDKDINRIKVVLAEKKRTNKWRLILEFQSYSMWS